MHGYCDASFANSDNSKSISGYCFLLSGSLVSWYAHTQPVVALSTAEAEYMALTEAAKELIWLKLLLAELGHPQDIVTLFEDNEATIKIANNPQDHKRTKHIQVKYQGKTFRMVILCLNTSNLAMVLVLEVVEMCKSIRPFFSVQQY